MLYSAKVYLQVIVLLPTRVYLCDSICIHGIVVEIHFPDVYNFPANENNLNHIDDSYVQLRDKKLDDVVHDLLANHDNHKLNGKLKKAARCVTIVKSKSREVSVSSPSTLTKITRMLKESTLPGKSYMLDVKPDKYLDSSNIDKRRVKVDELEEEHLEGEAVFKV